MAVFGKMHPRLGTELYLSLDGVFAVGVHFPLPHI